MRWQDQAIILGAKLFGETSLILEIFSQHHGYHKGLLKGGNSKSKKPLVQAGNLVDIAWTARLGEQLGLFSLEVYKYYSVYLMQSSLMLYGFETLRNYIKNLAEREVNKKLYDLLLDFLQSEANNHLYIAEIFLKFEFAYINAMGVGPDLSCCAATKSKINLRYISPKSLQAVCFDIGKDWHHKLLPLPIFLRDNQRAQHIEDIIEAYKLTTYFLEYYVYNNAKNLLSARKNFFTIIFNNLQAISCK